MKQLAYYFQGYLKETILGPFFKLLEASFELLVPLVIAKIIDTIIPTGNQQSLVLMLTLLVALAFIGVLVANTAQYYSSKAAVGYTRALTDDLFAKVMALKKEDRDELTTASLTTRLISDTFQIQTGLNQFLRLFLRAPIIVFGAIIMAYLISPAITLWFLLMVLALFIVVFCMSKWLAPFYDAIRQATDQMVAITRQQLEGVRVIRAFNQISREEAEFTQTNTSLTRGQLQAGKLASLVSPLTFLIVNATLVMVMWQGYWQISHNRLSQGLLIALINYLLQILTELLKTTMLVASLNQSIISAKRIQAVFQKESEHLDAPLESHKSESLALEARQLYFSYPQSAQPSLQAIDFQVKPGEVLGIIGGTGSGKSTLVQLMAHLYQAQSGTLRLYHAQKSPTTIRSWRRLVRVVPQKAELFQGSIRSNLLLGISEHFADDILWQALELAQAKDFVAQKEGGLDAKVEAFGRNFSGGQRQRLTIARALLRQTPFLILDDATSALDYVTEHRLLTAIREHFRETTLILVSQRTNSLKKADHILVLDKGQQAGFANHETLLKTNAVYQAIHYSQHKEEDKS